MKMSCPPDFREIRGQRIDRVTQDTTIPRIHMNMTHDPNNLTNDARPDTAGNEDPTINAPSTALQRSGAGYHLRSSQNESHSDGRNTLCLTHIKYQEHAEDDAAQHFVRSTRSRRDDRSSIPRITGSMPASDAPRGTMKKDIKRDMRALHHDNAMYAKELHICKQALHSIQRENDGLKRELYATKQDLAACKDDLFRLQPLPSKSDSFIVDEMEKLERRIICWVDSQLDAFETNFQGAAAGSITVRSEQNTVDLAQHYAGTEEYLVRYRLYDYLDEHILSQGLQLLGLSESQISFLHQVENSIYESNGDQGTSSILFDSTIADERKILRQLRNGASRHLWL